MIARDTPATKVPDTPARLPAAWLMTAGFLVYTLLILVGHMLGFPLGYTYLHTVCSEGCSLTAGNVYALERVHLSIAFYVNFYEVIQVIYILVCVGVGLLIVFKKPGRWVPLGMSFFLVGLSAYEGANYPALMAISPVLSVLAKLLIALGMNGLGAYALYTFPNGQFGSRWILGYFLCQCCEALLAAFINNPLFVLFDTVFGLLSFPIMLGIIIYRYRRLLNARERAAIKWIILSLSLFIIFIIPILFILPVLTPADSLVFLLYATFGFFGCGINIAGFLMAVLYANAFDIDVFVRRTLVYTLLTAILILLYTGLVLGSQVILATFSPQAAQSPIVLVGSTLVIAALFQPLRHRLQQIIDRRFYRQKYDASRVIERFGTGLHNEIHLEDLSEQLVEVVQDTMQPTHISLWLRKPTQTENQPL